MADFTVPETPVYNEHIRKMEITDPAHVDYINGMIQPLVENSAYLKSLSDLVLLQSNEYTDRQIAGLINGAPETLDTLKELADAIKDNQTIVEALDNAIGNKANQTELNSHMSNGVIHVTSSDKTGWNAAVTKVGVNSTAIGNLNNQIEALEDKLYYLGKAYSATWAECTTYSGGFSWSELKAVAYLSYIPNCIINRDYLVKFSNGAICKVTSLMSGSYWSTKNAVWLNDKSMGTPMASNANFATEWGMPAFVGNSSGSGYSINSASGPAIAMSSINKSVKSWYCLI